MSTESSISGNCVIAVDAMGGDFGAQVVIPALVSAAQQRAGVSFLIYGDEAKIKPHLSAQLSQYPEFEGRYTIRHTQAYIPSDEKPSQALRNSKGTSMRMAIEAVENGLAQAVVSAGNTGALMALAKMVLKPLSGVHRPAIASIMPGVKGDTVMLDLGANVLVDAENLVQFAVLGSIFAKIHKKIEAKPSVGLLNIGTEENKGPEHVKAAAAILARMEFSGRYHGYVEGDEILRSVVDVIVCDGYAGNVALKTAEGVGKVMKAHFSSVFKSDPLAFLGGMLAYFSLKRLQTKFDPRLYNGGVFLGLNGLCVKSHGGADSVGFASAVMLAARLAQQDYVRKISMELAHLQDQEMFISDDL